MPPSSLLLALALLAGPAKPPAAPGAPAARPGPRLPPAVDADRCVHQGRAFEVTLRRPADAAEGELLLTLDQAGRSAEGRRLNEPARRRWRLAPPPAPPGWRPGGACGRLATAPATAGRLLLLVPVAAPEGPERLHGLLYEAVGNRVLDTQDLGPVRGLEAPAGGALRLRLAPPGGGAPPPGPGAAAGDALPEGDRLASVAGAPRWLEPVVGLSTEGNRIRAVPDVDRTWRTAAAAEPAIAGAFPDAAAFGAAFGLGRPGAATAYLAGRSARGRACVLPLAPGGQATARWRCGPAAP